jgi:hypothetical protein
MPADRLAIRDWAQAAKALGFDFLEVSDHVLGADWAALPDFQEPYDVDDAFHVTCYTSGRGVGAAPQPIEAMRQFHAAVR